METWESAVDRRIREAIEQGAFDDLPGNGKPADLSGNPFEDRLAGTMRRILRDNGVSHPLIEARRAIEAEIEQARRVFLRDRRKDCFRERIRALNREIKLFNLRSPLPNFHLRVVDADAEIESLAFAQR
jgi:hypothetical protein